MADLLFEALIAILMGAISVQLTRVGRKRFGFAFLGWRLLLAGFFLVTAGSALDFGDNFQRYRDLTDYDGFDVGSFVENALLAAGFALLLGGLMSTSTTFQSIADEIVRRIQSEAEFRQRDIQFRASEKRFRAIFDNAPLWISIKDLDGTYSFVNEPYARRLGLTPPEIVGRKRSEVHSPEVADYSAELDRRVLATVAPVQEERDFYDAAGRFERSRLYVKFPILNDAGEVASIGSATLDTTERRRAEKEAEEQRRLLRAIIDNSSAHILLNDLEGRYLLVNEAFAAARGRKPGDFIGMSNRDGRTLDRSDRIVSHARRVIESRSAISEERTAVMNDGSRVEMLVTKFPVEDSEGRLSAIGTISVDITEQKDAQRRLKDSEGRLREILDKSPVAIAIVRGGAEGRLYRNEAFVRLFSGLTDGALGSIGESWIDPEARNRIIEQLRTVDAIGPIVVERRRADGTRFWCLSHHQRIEDFDGGPAYIGWALDVSPQLEAERLARETGQRLHAFMEHAPCAMTMRDLDGRYLMVNNRFCDIVGIERDAIIGRRGRDFFSDHLVDHVSKQEVQVLETGVPAISIYRTEGREAIYREQIVFPVSDETGAIVAVGRFGFDVTDRVKTAERLVERERELDRIVEALKFSLEGISVQDADRNVIFANEMATRMRGLDPGAVEMGKSWDEACALANPELFARGERELYPALDREGRWAGELRLSDSGGRQRDVQLRATRLPDGDVIFILTDVTEQKRAERALAESNERFRSVVENAAIGIALKDVEGRYLLANAGYRALFGFRQQDIAGRHAEDLFGEAMGKQVCAQDAAVIEAGAARSWELEYRRADGVTVSASTTKFPVFEPDGRLNAVGTIAQDVTAIRRSERMLRSIIDNVPAMIVLLDRDLRVTFVNEEQGRRLGKSPAECAGRPMLEAFGEKLTGVFAPVVRQVLESGQALRNQQFASVNRPGGTILVNLAPLTEPDGQVSGVLGVTLDVTERKQAEQQLIQAGKLATLGEMAAGMVHELGQPLNVIKLSAEGTLLRIARGRADPDYQRQQFERIDAQATRMAEIIQHIRIFSRRDVSNFEPFDARLAVEGAVDLMREQLRSKGIALIHRPSRFPATVRGRPVQLEQVILNLLSNARDAIEQRTKPGGEAAVEAGRIRVSTAIDREHALVRISVEDNGGGIPDADLGHLFEPFYTTKEPGKGTGLGLSISYGIISSMSGTIEARNAARGAIFDVVLPCQGPDVDAIGHPSTVGSRIREHIANGMGYRVLLVDDEAEAVANMADFLDSSGFDVVTASDGAAAYERFLAQPADLVITDLRMPMMNGRNLIRRLRALDPALPVIVASGDLGETETLEAALAGGNTRLLRKPIGLEALAEAIFALLEARYEN